MGNSSLFQNNKKAVNECLRICEESLKDLILLLWILLTGSASAYDKSANNVFEMKSLIFIAVSIVCLTGCATYQDIAPATGPKISIHNPSEHKFKIWIDNYRAGKIPPGQTLTVTATESEHLVFAQNRRVLPFVCFWHFTRRYKGFIADTSAGQDCNVTIDKWYVKKSWFFIVTF